MSLHLISVLKLQGSFLQRSSGNTQTLQNGNNPKGLKKPEKILGVTLPQKESVGHGEVRVYRGTGVSRGVRRATWERSLKMWELQIPCFEEFLWGGTLWDSSLPVSLTLWDTPALFTPPLPLPQVWQKSDEKSDRSVRKSDRKLTKTEKEKD